MGVRSIDTAPRRLLSVMLLCLFLEACDESPKPQQSAETSAANADAVLMKDVARAGRELEQRLLRSVSVQDGLILVRDSLTGKFISYVLPATSPWVISCGIGLSVIFGTAVSGDGSSVGNEVEVHLALSRIDQDACVVLAPQLGRRLKALLEEPARSP